MSRDISLSGEKSLHSVDDAILSGCLCGLLFHIPTDLLQAGRDGPGLDGESKYA
jgi:hypothetical protein